MWGAGGGRGGAPRKSRRTRFGRPHPPRTFGFPDLLAGVDPALRFNLPNYTRKELCDPYEGSEVHMIMGTNDAGGCIYWDYTDLPNQWECLNDGTCGQSINGKYNTEALCKSACGGSWTCMKNQVKVGISARAVNSSNVQRSNRTIAS